MDNNQAIKICKASSSSKEQLREALAWSLDIDVPIKKRKSDNSVFNVCKNIFIEEYNKQNQFVYVFRARDGAALAEIIKKIEIIVENSTLENKVETTFKIIVEKLPEWYRKNAFSLPVINSKFNQIVTCIKQNHGQKQPVSDDYKARIVGDLLS